MSRFTEGHFRRLTDVIQERFGIIYGSEKKEILATRAAKVMASQGIDNWDEFIAMIVSGRDMAVYQAFTDAITVNTTNFFREAAHFDFILENAALVEKKNPSILSSGEIRAWSAASSSGEEAYTLAMILHEAFGDRFAIKILGTDIDSRVLSRAQAGLYSPEALKDVPPRYLQRYFAAEGGQYSVSRQIRRLVTFRQFNLMENFPFKNRFDFVFCRNLMIYFGRETQVELISKIFRVMNQGGLLFTGHSEPLPDKTIRLKFLRPAVYLKY